MRAQIAMEFIVMLGLAVIITMVFLSVFQTILAEKNENARIDLINDLGTAVQREFLIANVMEPGYIRTFSIPPRELNQSFEAHPFAVNLSEGTIIITQDGDVYEFAVPNATGTLRLGDNTIKNVGGTVYVNP